MNNLYRGRGLSKLSIGGQSIIEYVIILAIVAIISIAFVPRIPKLFVGYVESAREAMR